MTIPSEAIEPTMALITGEMFSRCEKAKGDPFLLESTCMGFWWTVIGMNNVAIGLRTGLKSDDPQCIHFSIASMNNLRRAAEYIMNTLGVDPFEAPGWGWTPGR